MFFGGSKRASTIAIPSFAVFPFCFGLRSAHRGECVRLKQFVTDSEIIDNDVSYCGVHDYRYNEGNENGEAIYIGTSSNQVTGSAV